MIKRIKTGGTGGTGGTGTEMTMEDAMMETQAETTFSMIRAGDRIPPPLLLAVPTILPILPLPEVLLPWPAEPIILLIPTLTAVLLRTMPGTKPTYRKTTQDMRRRRRRRRLHQLVLRRHPSQISDPSIRLVVRARDHLRPQQARHRRLVDIDHQTIWCKVAASFSYQYRPTDGFQVGIIHPTLAKEFSDDGKASQGTSRGFARGDIPAW